MTQNTDAENTAAWDSATRILSFDATTAVGANGYALNLEEESPQNGVGLLMNSDSFTLPAALVTEVLDEGAKWDVQVIPAWIPAGTDLLRVGFELVQIMPVAARTAVDLIP